MTYRHCKYSVTRLPCYSGKYFTAEVNTGARTLFIGRFTNKESAIRQSKAAIDNMILVGLA